MAFSAASLGAEKAVRMIRLGVVLFMWLA